MSKNTPISFTPEAYQEALDWLFVQMPNYQIEGQKAKPKTGANSSNTYEIGRSPILVVAGQLALRLW